MKKVKILNKTKYYLERIFVKSAFHQLLFVALLIGIISFVGGLMVYLFDHTDQLSTSVWWAFLRLTDPGYLGDDVGTFRRIVSIILTILGYVIFLGALVAIMTRWLIHGMNHLEQGLTPVSVKNHIVILGWTNRTIPILRDLIGSRGRMTKFLKANDTNRLRIVVLSENVSTIQTQELKQDPIIKDHIGEIILRQGNPIQPSAIHRTACTSAAAIIIPSQFNVNDLISSDTETIKALFSINKLANEQSSELPYVVVEIEDARKLPVIQHTYKGPLEIISSDRIISRLIAQTILHPGLTEVYNELLVFGEGNEFYLKNDFNWVGLSLSEVDAMYPKAILCGILRKNQNEWKAFFNCSSSDIVKNDDKVIWIARNHREIETKANKGINLNQLKRQAKINKTLINNNLIKKKILILGWNSRIPAFIHELSKYDYIQFNIDLFSILSSEKCKEDIWKYSENNEQMNCNYIEADFMIEKDLLQLDLNQYDSIIVISSDHLPTSEEGDARAIAGYLMLDDFFENQSKRPQVILELNNYENLDLVSHFHCETFVSPIILSHFLSQIALRKELRIVYDELLTAKGSAEITFKTPTYYNLKDVNNFHDLEHQVAAYGDTALGIYYGKTNEKGDHLILNPDKDFMINIKDDDLIVVLTNTSV